MDVTRVTAEVRGILQATIWELCSNDVMCMWRLGILRFTGFASGSNINTALVLADLGLVKHNGPTVRNIS